MVEPATSIAAGMEPPLFAPLADAPRHTVRLRVVVPPVLLCLALWSLRVPWKWWSTFALFTVVFVLVSVWRWVKSGRSPLNRLQAEIPPARRASILAFDPSNTDAVRTLLATAEPGTVELDGVRIRSVDDLARELDAALGPFQHPTDPLAKVLAHFGHESRGVGERAILWTGAATMRSADPQGFARVIAAWSRAMWHTDGRLLLLDAVPAA